MSVVPFLNLQKINARFEKDFQTSFSKFLDSGQYILGHQVTQFESQFSGFCGTKHCVGVSSGLAAIELVLKGYIELGKLQKGDEVIVPANTFIASILAIVNAGLTPVLVDVSKDCFNLSVNNISPHITKKTKVILVVHLHGELVDTQAIALLAKTHNLLLIEDAAQAHGARNDINLKAGNLGDAAAFSFYPTKNLGALGDGGAITTNNTALAKIIKKIRNYGSSTKYIHDIKGVNARLDELQAVFLLLKLTHLESDNKQRQEIAKQYCSEITNPKIVVPSYTGGSNHVFHVFVVRCKKRDELQQYLLEKGIQTLIHYPIPPHKQNALKAFNELAFKNTETLHDEVLSLPISPVQSLEDTKKIIRIINQF